MTKPHADDCLCRTCHLERFDRHMTAIRAERSLDALARGDITPKSITTPGEEQ